MKTNRLKLKDLSKDLQQKARELTGNPKDIDKLFFKVVDNKIVAYSETDLKDQPV